MRAIPPVIALGVACALGCLGCAGNGGPSDGPADGSLADANIRTIGRWETADPSAYRAHWCNGYLRVGFTGSAIRARVGGPALLQVSIDGGWVRDLVTDSAGSVDLLPAPLAPGRHTLYLADIGRTEDFALESLELAPGSRTFPIAQRPIIEFVGDSISASTLACYAWWASEALGCDHVQVADTGWTLLSGLSPGAVGAEAGYERGAIPRLRPEAAEWDFSYQPAIVVVNLGTNDWVGVPSLDPERFTAAYAALLATIRGHYPEAEIVVVRTFGGYGVAPTRAAYERRLAAGDPALHYLDTEGWLSRADYDSTGYHPNQRGTARLTARFVEYLRPLLGAQAARAERTLRCPIPGLEAL